MGVKISSSFWDGHRSSGRKKVSTYFRLKLRQFYWTLQVFDSERRAHFVARGFLPTAIMSLPVVHGFNCLHDEIINGNQ